MMNEKQLNDSLRVYARIAGRLSWLAVFVLLTFAYSIDVKGEVPTVAKLNFSQVHFYVRTQPDLEKRLTTRALARFQKAGLTPADPGNKSSRVIATLILTLDPRPLGPICPGKVMYDNRLQLFEDVVLARNSEMNVEAITWSLAPGVPSIANPMPIEQVEQDLDKYIDQFIVAYKLGNR